MFNFLFNTTENIVIDKYADSFSGSSANVDFGSYNKGALVVAFILGAITMLIILGIIKYIKIKAKNNKELKEEIKKYSKSDE